MLRNCISRIAKAARLALGLALCATATGADRAEHWSAKSMPLADQATLCARLPIRIDARGDLGSIDQGTMFLGDPLAFGIGLAIADVRNDRVAAAQKTIAWPAFAEVEALIRDRLLEGFAASGLATPVPADDPAATSACPLDLHVVGHLVLRTDLEGMAMLVNAALVDRVSGALVYRGRLEVDSPQPALIETRKMRERKARLADFDGEAVRTWIAGTASRGGALLAYDLGHFGREPKSRDRQRYRFASNFLDRLTLVRRGDGEIYLRSRHWIIVSRPDWAKVP